MGSNLSFPVVDLNGKVAIITGGNTGIGYETAKAIAVMGAHTIIACRSLERATAAVERLKEEVGIEFPEKSVTIEIMSLDLGSFRSTKDFTVAFREKDLPLHILINNAGVAWLPFSMTEDGYEAQFQVNHLSHFLLTLELLPIMLDTASNTGDCRIVFVSSRLHMTGSFTPGNMNAEEDYSRTKFYGNSKLYNVMTAYSLQRRLISSGITVSSLHPGSVETELGRNTVDSWWLNFFYKAYKFAFKPVLKDAQAGATTTLNCAVNPALNSQTCLYYSDCKPTPSSVTSRSTQYQEQLWEISINIIKDWMSVGILDQFGPTMGFEEEGSRVTESHDLRAEDRDRQVTITEGESGISMITFRSQEKEEEENEVNGVINHHLPNDLEQNIVDERSNKDL